MAIDTTVIFLTINKLPEQWVAYHKKVLLEAIGNFPLITVSKKSMPDMPGINIIQDEPISASNIYFQMLKAAKLANTPFIAIAEDDSLYPLEHFIKFRPKEDEFAYNLCRWGLLTWGKPTYFWRNRISNLTLIAPRELLIKALIERFNKYPNGTPPHKTGELGKTRYEKSLGLTCHKIITFYTTVAVVNLSHQYALDPIELNQKKRMGYLRSFDIPYWGKADELVKKFC